MHPLSSRRRSIQADHRRPLGSPSLRYLDSRGRRGQPSLYGTYRRHLQHRQGSLEARQFLSSSSSFGRLSLVADTLLVPFFCQNCVLCNDKSGSCIQCMHPKCFDAWHVTCARDAHLLGSMKTNGEDGGDGVLEAYCKKHIPVSSRLGLLPNCLDLVG
jgi:hypothetical protein